jgi:hypothetical protein
VDVVRKGYSVIKRISLLIAVALMAVMMMAATAMPAMAKPITCPGKQDVVKDKGGGGESNNFSCQNNGGNISGAEKRK